MVDDTFSRRFLRDRCKAVTLEFGAEFTIVFVDTAIEEIGSRRDANNQRPTCHHVRDDIFEDHYKTFLFPTAEEPFVRVVEGFDLQSWWTKPKLERFPLDVNQNGYRGIPTVAQIRFGYLRRQRRGPRWRRDIRKTSE